MFDFKEDQIKRYSRHIILPEVGGKGQKRLLQAKVFIVGVGGVSCAAAYYLAAAGIGTIGMGDNDKVELSNLQRQILYKTKDVGGYKVESAKETLGVLNPDVDVKTYNFRITEDNIMDIIKDYDLIIDGSDNFPTHYLVNDACVLTKKPLFAGGVFQSRGQVFTVIPKVGPCYRCLFESPPPPGFIPSSQEAGILNVLPGIIGLIQATEVIKYILGKGDLLTDYLLLYDALGMEFKKVRIKRDPKCVVCGDNPTQDSLIDYEEFCHR